MWFKKAEKEALDAAIRALGVPATGLSVEPSDPNAEFPPTSSHFGGTPYFEVGDTWPMAPDGSAYDFVCQINLNDCPNRPDVPYDLCTVFISFATELFDHGDSQTCIVKAYRQSSDKTALEIPRPDTKENWTEPCRITTYEFTNYPSWSVDGIDLAEIPTVAKAASAINNPTEAIRASLKRLGWGREPSHVGGFPTWVHDNTLLDDDTAFLAQIEYEPRAGNCIGDASPIFIAYLKNDPTVFFTDVWQTH